MAGTGHKISEGIGTAFRPTGVGGGFHCVYIQMLGQRMSHVARDHCLQGRNHFDGLRSWILGIQPIIPGHGIHQGFCKHRLSVIVLGIFGCEQAHCVRIGHIEIRPIAVDIPVVARRLGINVVSLSLACRRLQGHSFLYCRVG